MKIVSSLTRETTPEKRGQGTFHSRYELYVKDRSHNPLLISDSHYLDGKLQHGGLEPIVRGRESDLKVRHSFPMLKFLFWDEDHAPVFQMGDGRLKFHHSGESLSVNVEVSDER